MATKIGNQNLLNNLRVKYEGTNGPKGINGPKGWYVAKEQEKQKNMKEIIDALSDAILETGKPFKDIPKKSITDYLTKVGVNRSKHEEIYQKLSEIYKVKNKVTTKSDVSKDKTPSPVTKVVHPHAVTAKTKERQPRKNVFSEITKIH
jgi:hypothetical protein